MSKKLEVINNFDKNKLKEIAENMGLVVEFDSKKPGFEINGKFISYDTLKNHDIFRNHKINKVTPKISEKEEEEC